MRSVATICTSLVIPLLLSAPLTAEMATVPAAADNTLYENENGDRSNGRGPYFFAGRLGDRGGGLRRRGVIRFDVASQIPARSVITSVLLELNLSNEATSGDPVSLHRAVDDWGEGSSTDASGNGMGAVNAAAGDATWLFRFFDTDRWNQDGGDFIATPSATATVGRTGAQVWGPSDGMRANVQGWLDRPEQNFGWIVVGDETKVRTVKRFDSRESGSAENRPMLIVEYEPPSATPTLSPIPTLVPTATHSPSPTSGPPTATPTTGACVGDCDGDGTLRIAELVRGVNIALGRVAIDQCPEFDANRSGRVEISELIAAVNGALRGCIPVAGT